MNLASIRAQASSSTQQTTPTATSTPRPTATPRPSNAYYLVIDRVDTEGGPTCKLTLDADLSNAIKRSTEGTRDDLCVTKVNVTIGDEATLKGDLGSVLIGMFPATDENGQPIPFQVYLPSIK
jgi:hypothetical protein